MSLNKSGYFQGGGGVNEPEPKKKKYKSDPAIVVQPRFKEPFYRNYDLYNTPGEHSSGAGWHDMEKYKSIQEFLKAKRKKLKDKYKADDSWIQDDNSKTKKNPDRKARMAIFDRIIKTADHMMPPKEHGTSIYDWKHSIYQGTPKSPNKKYRDSNDIDFPIDEEVNHYDEMIYPEEGQYHKPSLVGPSGTDDLFGQPGDEGPGALQSAFQSAQIAGEHSYVPEHDFAGRSDEALNFGRDYDDETGPGRDHDDTLQKLFNKYLTPNETGLFGLPDGVDPESHDADQTEQVENPFTGTSDIGTQMYEDKWNI